MLPREMRFSLQVHYAICGCFDLAYNGEGEPVPIQVIGERQQIPVRYSEQIFGHLRRAGVVTSKRGPGGGYTLARPPAEITLREIIEAVEGSLTESLRMAPPSDAGAGYRPDFVWQDLAERFAEMLESTTLHSLCLEAANVDVPRAHPEAPMYFI